MNGLIVIEIPVSHNRLTTPYSLFSTLPVANLKALGRLWFWQIYEVGARRRGPRTASYEGSSRSLSSDVMNPCRHAVSSIPKGRTDADWMDSQGIGLSQNQIFTKGHP